MLILLLPLLPFSVRIVNAQKSEFYTIQTGAYMDFKSVESAMAELKANGMEAFYRFESVAEKGACYYRIFVGKYSSKGEADHAALKLKGSEGISDAFVKLLSTLEDTSLEDLTKDSDLLHSYKEALKSDLKQSSMNQEPITITDSERKNNSPMEILTSVKDITFTLEKWKRESVFVQMGQYFLPSMNFSLEGDKPMLTIKLACPEGWKGPAEIPVRGEWIERIRTRLYPMENSLDIILELSGFGDYLIVQDYNPDSNIFTVAAIADE
jgi:hypothetical protein